MIKEKSKFIIDIGYNIREFLYSEKVEEEMIGQK